MKKHTYIIDVETPDNICPRCIGEYIRLAVEEHAAACDMDAYEGIRAAVSVDSPNGLVDIEQTRHGLLQVVHA